MKRSVGSGRGQPWVVCELADTPREGRPWAIPFPVQPTAALHPGRRWKDPGAGRFCWDGPEQLVLEESEATDTGATESCES